MTKKMTPMIEQYVSIKNEVPDALLFFRLGDFYEMFFEDAIVAAKELEITLTGRGQSNEEERIPMCGVPHHSAEQYVTRLVEKGYKVAICEQMEDPKQAKGVVKREIVRIVTPGTVMEEKGLASEQNNYMAAVTQAESTYALLVCDLSTGELFATEVADEDHRLLDELLVYSPKEIITTAALADQIEQQLATFRKRVLVSTREVDSQLELQEHFTTEDLERLSTCSLAGLNLLIGYLQETQKRTLAHVGRIRTYEPQQYMMLDPMTRKNLELTESVRDGGKHGTLLWLLDQTVTAMGARLLKRWVDKPLLSREPIDQRLEAVETLVEDLFVREELREHLKKVYDLERLAGRIAYGSANARDLLALKVSLEQVPTVLQASAASGSKTLQQLTAQIDACTDLCELIAEAIADDPPTSLREGGLIRAGYDDYLDKLQEASTNGKQWIAELEQREREATGIKSLKIGFNKVFGYYIEVTRANLSLLPEGRYERKQTLANAERFVTPELKEKEILILEAEEKRVDLEYELFIELRNKLQDELERLQLLAEVVAVIDVYQSLARVSAERQYVRPQISEGFDLACSGIRHPVVEAMLPQERFIRNDANLTEDEQRVLLITGPNMAGKSTYMRQVALLNIMAQMGCFVPAEAAKVPLVDRIFTRIGAADDLAGGQSTFMVEMKDIQVMADQATARSLVIIDELGRGTSTSEGMAIAQAVIEYLHDHTGCKTLVSTHFHELAQLENELAYLQNYSMAVKESGRTVTFLRKLVKGAADTSYGIYCAQIAGVKPSIIDRAYELLQLYEGNAEVAVGLEPSDEQHHANQHSANQQSADQQAGAVAQSSSLAGEAAEQLSLFAESEPVEAKPATRKLRTIEQEVIKQLEQTDVMNMTPLEAMQVINTWKQQLLQQ